MGKNFRILAVKTVLLGAILAVAIGQGTFALAVSNVQLSRNWSGYMSTNGKFTAVSATWVVPNVQPSQNFSGDMTWVGIGGFSSPDLIQAGTLALVSNGTVTYHAWYETLPLPVQTVPLDISAGDSVSVKISQQPDGLWLIELTNNTISQTFRTSVFYNSSFSSAEWIEEMAMLENNIYLPLDYFGNVNFNSAGAEMDGRFVNLFHSGAHAINMVGLRQETLAIASEINSDGFGFTVKRPPLVFTDSEPPVPVLTKGSKVSLKAQKSIKPSNKPEPKFKVPLVPIGPMPQSWF